jgi:hypothetical protein
MPAYFLTKREPVELRGYFMRHKTGGDVGFSWEKDDERFSEDWERIATIPEVAPSPGAAPTVEVGEPSAYMGLDGKVYSASVGRICVTDEPLYLHAALVSRPAGEAEDAGVLAAALLKIIEMNRQEALARYGDANKAESWSCIRVARSALAAKPATQEAAKDQS